MPSEHPSGDMAESIASAYSEIQRDIRNLRPNCQFLAVSKGQSIAKIEMLYSLGQRDFGENYVTELESKAPLLGHCPGIRWVYIGQLQSNKIARIVELAAEIQTATSEKHLRYINRYAHEFGKVPYPVWIEVNAGDEATKGGIDPAAVERLVAVAGGLDGIEVQGIMSIPPAEISDEQYYDRGLQPPELFKKLQQVAEQTGRGRLSLGMSGDYRTALQAGSTCVRIGSALFGKRTG